jgi:peptidoglycan/LPS O-acetylase OafA/YrhL
MAAPAAGPTTGTPEKKRVPTLDGIRGFCAITVVITHVAFSTFVLSSAFGDPKNGIWSILAAGQVGAIGPFFVMSGMLLYRPFARRTFSGTPYPQLGSFYIRRAARLLPAFWLLVTFCLVILNLDSLHSTWDVLRPYALMHVYNFHYYAGMDVAWTVPAEFQFYLAIPVVGGIMHLLARNVVDPAAKARRMLAPLVLLVVGQLVWTYFLNTHFGPWPPQFFYPFGVAGLFAIGMAMAVWSVLAEVAPDKKPKFFGLAVRHPNMFWLGALAAYAINCAQPFAHPGTADWLNWKAAVIRSALLLAFSFFIMVPLVIPGATSRLQEVTLGNAPARYLGRISYGIYLWHFPMMYLWFQSGSIFGKGKTIPVGFLLGKFGFWELVIPTLVGTIIIASISYWVMERPIINAVERWSKKKHLARQQQLAVVAAVPDEGRKAA